MEYNCQKCSTDNCEICHGTKLNNICISCKNKYNLIDGKCLKISIIEATFYIDKSNLEIKLINSKANVDLIEILVDETSIGSNYNYLFSSIGNQHVKFLLNIEKCESLTGLFSSIYNLNFSFY